MVGQIGRQVSVFTVGYGGEHDADLLQGVSEAGNGLFYYIDNADSIPESFCDCLGGLLSVAAHVRACVRACVCEGSVGLVDTAVIAAYFASSEREAHSQGSREDATAQATHHLYCHREGTVHRV